MFRILGNIKDFESRPPKEWVWQNTEKHSLGLKVRFTPDAGNYSYNYVGVLPSDRLAREFFPSDLSARISHEFPSDACCAMCSAQLDYAVTATHTPMYICIACETIQIREDRPRNNDRENTNKILEMWYACIEAGLVSPLKEQSYFVV